MLAGRNIYCDMFPVCIQFNLGVTTAAINVVWYPWMVWSYERELNTDIETWDMRSFVFQDEFGYVGSIGFVAKVQSRVGSSDALVFAGTNATNFVNFTSGSQAVNFLADTQFRVIRAQVHTDRRKRAPSFKTQSKLFLQLLQDHIWPQDKDTTLESRGFEVGRKYSTPTINHAVLTFEIKLFSVFVEGQGLVSLTFAHLETGIRSLLWNIGDCPQGPHEAELEIATEYDRGWKVFAEVTMKMQPELGLSSNSTVSEVMAVTRRSRWRRTLN